MYFNNHCQPQAVLDSESMVNLPSLSYACSFKRGIFWSEFLFTYYSYSENKNITTEV